MIVCIFLVDGNSKRIHIHYTMSTNVYVVHKTYKMCDRVQCEIWLTSFRQKRGKHSRSCELNMTFLPDGFSMQSVDNIITCNKQCWYLGDNDMGCDHAR